MKIGVVFGGNSVEHDISIITGTIIMNKLRELHEVIPLYLNKNNELFTSKNFFEIDNFKKEKGKRTDFVHGGIKKEHLDHVMICVHGKDLEDGNIKAVLDFYQIPNSGVNLIASAVCQDKIFFKDVLKSKGFLVPEYFEITKGVWFNNYQAVLEQIEIAYPIVVKPSTLGSSIGINISKNKRELIEHISLAFKYDSSVILEEFLEKEEFEIAVMGNGDEAILSEVKKIDADFFSFKDKYENKYRGSKLSQDQKLEELVKKAYFSLRLNGVVRFDCFKVGEQYYINEVNTIPGNLSRNLWNLSDEEFFNNLFKYSHKKEIITSFKSSFLYNSKFYKNK